MEKNNCTQVQINYEIFCKTKRTFLSEPFSLLPEPFLNRANYGRHKKSVLRALHFLAFLSEICTRFRIGNLPYAGGWGVLGAR